MHLLVRDTVALDDEVAAVDLGQSAADLVFLSFSDADLGGVARAWAAMSEPKPSVRLANLVRLRHPLSVDLYVEQVIAQAKCVVVRILGGADYWRYGVDEVAAVCRARGIALVMVEGDARPDPRLAELSTIPDAVRRDMADYLREGGPANLAGALSLAAHLAGLEAAPANPPHPLPAAGPEGAADPLDGRPRAMVVCYRSHGLSGDVAPIEALAVALRARGLAVEAHFVTSLKDPAAADYLAARYAVAPPDVILNATGFSARCDGGSPLDRADVPVLQVILSADSEQNWRSGFRGVSQTDLAMQVALPELDGRLLTSVISFKAQAETLAGLEFARTVNRPHAAGIALAADRAAGWVRLARTGRAARRIALVVSDYPGVAPLASGQTGHAVGLDSFASIAGILGRMAAMGFGVGEGLHDADALTHDLCRAAPGPALDLVCYRAWFAELPAEFQARVIAAWGAPERDSTLADGRFMIRLARCGNVVLAVQPDRGSRSDRKSLYHDADCPPCHGYIAFYLWLRRGETIHALIHLGTHGTLEWLPGKAAALSDACCPVALLRGLPVIYPFIVNNPGEAAAAKRRLGAVTIGHLTPVLVPAGLHGAASELERLIDEYAAADGLDRRRSLDLRQEILRRAGETGLLGECGVAPDAPDDIALARLDAYLCDVKDLQIRDGLHVFGQAPAARDAMLADLQHACPEIDAASLAARLDGSAAAEMAGLMAALDGKFIHPGPAGAPSRGRPDVLPTGRNLTSLDPRLLPTRLAVARAEKAADALLQRHRQDQGDDLRRTMIDLWGSASLRTGGEDFALALLLMGVVPLWDAGSWRVSGFEVRPIALLDRPRVDVTLRISGLFRDAFESQIALFDAAVRAVAARDEAAGWNPLAAAARGLEGSAFRAATVRVYGAAPGDYGSGIADRLARGLWRDRSELGAAYLAASSSAYGKDLDGVADASGFAARIAGAETFVHQQDHAETDILESPEYAAHEGGFAAAAVMLGSAPTLYHLDSSRPEVLVRSIAEEVARVVRGRLANPRWLAGMMRHGYRGAAEIARGLDTLHGFAATMPARFDLQFDLVFEATLADPAVDGFLRAANPDARAAMAARFADARQRDLWHPRRNDVSAMAT